MTALLLGLGAIVLACAALYLYLAQDALKALWYRLFHDPEAWQTDVEEAYDSAFAEAPHDREPRCGIGSDPLDEHFKTAPRVVAGSDIDRQKAISRTRTDITFGHIVDASLADLDTHLTAYYVLPEADR